MKKPCGNLSYRYNRKQKDRQRRTEKSLKEDNQSGVFGCWRKYLRKLGFCFCCARQNKIPEKYRYSKSLDRTTPKSGSHKEMKELAIKMIRFYQRKISPLFPPRCRYYPTCSQYAVTAIERFGIIRGGLLAVWRLLRCNPLFPGGLDPVPEKRNKKKG